MEKAYKEGKVRALGLSNFPQEKIAEVAKLDGTKKYYEATEEALAGYLAIKPDFDAQE